MNSKAIQDLLTTISEMDAPTPTDTMEAWLGRAVTQELITSKERFDICWAHNSSELAVKVLAKFQSSLATA
jgi:hypothetical protein